MSDIPTFPPSRQPSRLPLLAAAMLVGVVGGLGGTIASLWLFPELRRVYIPRGTPNVVLESPGTVVVEEDGAVAARRAALLPEVAYLFRRVVPPAGRVPTYPTGDAVGAAVLLTADGWLATVASAAPAVGDVAVVEGQPYDVERVVADSASPFIMIQVAAEDLPTPVVFADPVTRSPGMTALALAPSGDTAKTSLAATDWPLEAEALASSDRLSFGLTLVAVPSLLPGTPVFTLSGELLGLVERSQGTTVVVLPADTLAEFLSRVLQNGQPRRAALGVTFVVSAVVPVGEEGRGGVAIVVATSAPSGQLPPRSPAAGTLRGGDVLLAVNGQALVRPTDLYDIIQHLRPGDRVAIRYRRQHQTLEAMLTLAELSATP